MAQRIVTLRSGGAGLADAERTGKERIHGALGDDVGALATPGWVCQGTKRKGFFDVAESDV